MAAGPLGSKGRHGEVLAGPCLTFTVAQAREFKGNQCSATEPWEAIPVV